ncbi:hypothetical protein [Nocardiopsis sp. NRRL B-16309]|uniref:hypothetical protein n=1 Tax=Nocardiopsis sp. NRRL B-16309 TaxID=1519494 RepID=UPI0006AECDC5|nr:hypothetical protein [Nocardiopsis sp. NRRL B-16309]KOX11670.1 hypothetical protein ADL05_23200 [Nocardiopsis sp. NRRL B-16309]
MTTTPREVTLVYTNVESGLREGQDLDLLPEILAPTLDGEAPTLIGFCEGRWWARGGRARAEVARILRRLYGTHYQVEIGGIRRSDHPPTVAWRTDRLNLHQWSAPGNDAHMHGHNTARFSWTDDPSEQVALRVQIAHLDYASGDQRLIEAQTLAPQVDPGLTNILMADFNSALDGAHAGDRDWLAVPQHKRGEKAMLIQVNGVWTWVKDTRALRALTGPWDELTHKRLTDLGPGYRALAETDWEQRNRPACGLAATTTTDQALPIDHILADDTVELLPQGYEVHLNEHSDHGVIIARTRLHPRPRGSQ